MKQIEVIMYLRVPDTTDEKLLVGSIVDDALKSYETITEIEYDWRECRV